MTSTTEDIYDQATTPDTASAALTTLFATSGEYPHLDLAIDPNLDGAGAGGDDARPGVEGKDANVNDKGDGAHRQDEDAASPQADADGNTPAKRKATSRINMLPRGGACEFCKRRKLKCTAEQPQCRACARSGRECVYSQKQQRSRVRVLEDRLMELERRLDHERSANATQGSAGATTWGVPSVAESTPGSSSSHPFVAPEPAISAPSSGVDIFSQLGEAFTLADVPFPAQTQSREPDLMTLADAAAADTDGRQPWDGMEPADVANELYKTVVENKKGLGEKIVAHLLQCFSRPPTTKLIHAIVAPGHFFERLAGNKGQPPHPALIAALLPSLLPLSPSPTLHSRSTIMATCDAMSGPSRQLAQHALSNLDTRVLDLLAATALRSIGLAAMGRFVDAWNENCSAAGLVWATGIGKLGGVMEQFAPPELRPADRAERVARENRMRTIRGKGQIVPPAMDAQDVADRIRLFWCVYVCDRVNAIGWNWPASIDASEITTPLPRDRYETPDTWCDNTTLDDFISGRVTSAAKDSVFTLQVKTITLVFEASRLLDKSPVFSSPDRTAHLLRVTKRHMATLRPFAPTSPQDAIRKALLNQNWMGVYTAMMLLYSKEELDAPSPEEEAEAREKAIDAGLKMCGCIEATHEAGDLELSGYDVLAPTMWYVVGRAFHHLANRIEAQDPSKAALLREKVSLAVDATRKLSRQLKLAEVHAQMLHNVTLDAEVMLGEYNRPDNIDFMGDF